MNSSCSRSHFLVFLLGVSIGSSSDLLAQRTWIVDAAGGAGSNFNDLPAAVAVAAPGDRIEIVPSASLYSGARVTKGIAILARGAGVSLGSPLYLSGIPAGGTCVVSGIAFADTWLQVEQCKGAVVLFGLGPSRTWFSMNVLSSDAVCMDLCDVRGGKGSAMLVAGSNVRCTSSLILGLDIPYVQIPSLATNGILVAGSRLTLANCTVVGGRVLAPWLSLASAIRAIDADVVVTGGTSLLGAGLLAFEFDPPRASRLVLDPAATVIGSIATGTILTRFQMPAQLLTRYLGTTRLECRTLPGDAVAMLVGNVQMPIVGPFGELWLDPNLSILVDVGPAGATGIRSVPFTVPNLSAFHGIPFTMQSVVVRGGALILSLPTVTTIS